MDADRLAEIKDALVDPHDWYYRNEWLAALVAEVERAHDENKKMREAIEVAATYIKSLQPMYPAAKLSVLETLQHVGLP